jgi:hypothetical protein
MNLKKILLLDAATCVVTGTLLAVMAGKLSALLGLPEALLFYAGLALLPIAAFMAWTAQRPAEPAVWLVIGGNALWVLGSLAVLAMSPTGLGYAFVIGQAAVVAILAECEFIGLRRGDVRG